MSTLRAWQTPGLIRYIQFARQNALDVHCPDKPSEAHIWVDGQGWVIPADVADRRGSLAVDGMDRLIFEYFFNLENRIRVLEARPVITRSALKTALINFWKTINP